MQTGKGDERMVEITVYRLVIYRNNVRRVVFSLKEDFVVAYLLTSVSNSLQEF